MGFSYGRGGSKCRSQSFETYFILVNHTCVVCGKAAGRMKEGLPAVMTKVIAYSQKARGH